MRLKFDLKKIAVLLVFISAGIASCGDKSNKGGSGTGAPMVKPFEVLVVQPQKFTAYSDFPATIEGEENVEIRPKIDGYIERIFVDEGAFVRKGQVLFKISAPQYEQEVRTAQANIQIAEANVKAAEMEVNKVRPLVEKNIISKYELETTEFNLQAKQAALAQARATLVNAKTNIGYTSVTSPVNGVVGFLPYKIGSLVNSNTALP
ncbi:MAG: efflux RND transporter periplasmic adaptor subunit, partial [Ginsengibacter sp.]